MRAARFLLSCSILSSIAGPGFAQDRETTISDGERRRLRAVAAGLKYLAKEQSQGGHWGKQAGRVGITSLAVMAFMAQGHQEGRGPYGDIVRNGVKYLLQRSLPAPDKGRPRGYIWLEGDGDSRMHGHGYATQVFVLAYGTGGGKGGRRRASVLRDKIRLAVRIIENSQTVTGGWGYEPHNRSFHEGSVTVTLVQALRLARDAGFVVDKEVVHRGLRYLHESQKKSDGSFRYRLTSENSTPALTAAALTAMHGFGEYYTKAIRNGLDYVYAEYRQPKHIAWMFYSNYYTAQVFHRAGGRYWRRWQSRVIPFILGAQDRDGAWNDAYIGNTRKPHGNSYSTAFAVLALSVADGYLPTFTK